MLTKRQLILSFFDSALRSIRKDAAAGSEAFSQTIGFVGQGNIDVTNFADGEFPAALILADTPTTFEVDADGRSYQAVWPVVLCLVVKDRSRPSIQANATLLLLETFFRDVDLALHNYTGTTGSVDIGVTMTNFDPIPTADPTYGMGMVTLAVKYCHISIH